MICYWQILGGLRIMYRKGNVLNNCHILCGRCSNQETMLCGTIDYLAPEMIKVCIVSYL